MKTKEIYMKYKEHLCAIRGIINHYEKFNRCMSIASMDNEMNEALNKLVFVYAKIMLTVNSNFANCDDMEFTDIVAKRSCGEIIKNTTTFICKFASFFERDDNSFNYPDNENSHIDASKNYYLADIQFNINRAQRVVDRMGTLIKGSQYINQQIMVN